MQHFDELNEFTFRRSGKARLTRKKRSGKARRLRRFKGFIPLPKATHSWKIDGKKVAREVAIDAPDQHGLQVDIQLDDLPPVDQDLISACLNSTGSYFVTWAISPVVIVGKDARRSFDPPLQITVHYLDSDVPAGSHDSLTIGLGYRQGNGWIAKTVQTKQDREARTLTATLYNLDPKDPIWVGHP